MVRARVACNYLGEGGSVHVVLVVDEESGANEVNHLLPQRREPHDAGAPHASIAPKVRAHVGLASSSASVLQAHMAAHMDLPLVPDTTAIYRRRVSDGW